MPRHVHSGIVVTSKAPFVSLRVSASLVALAKRTFLRGWELVPRSLRPTHHDANCRSAYFPPTATSKYFAVSRANCSAQFDNR